MLYRKTKRDNTTNKIHVHVCKMYLIDGPT